MPAPFLAKNQSETQSTSTGFSLPVLRQFSDTVVPSLSRYMAENPSSYGRSISTVEAPVFSVDHEATAARLSERAAKIRAARERFLSSSGSMRRREGINSVSDLRRGDRYVPIFYI